MFVLLWLSALCLAANAVYDNSHPVCQEWAEGSTPSDETDDSCVAPGSKGKCEQCTKSSQCGSGRFCCPYLKQCVYSGEGCAGPHGGCYSMCYDQDDPAQCNCNDPRFPNEWVTCTNDPSKYAYYGGSSGQSNSGPVSYTRQEASDGSLLDSDEMAQGALCNHNRLRAAAGLQPLEWDQCLAEFAKTYAEHLRDTKNCGLEHSDSSQRQPLCGFSYVGENLYMAGSSAGINAETQRDAGWASTQAWWNEIGDYVYGMKSNGSPDGWGSCPKRNNQGDIGHFTQVMWADTTHLGCDQALCSGSHVVVCVYGAGGNWVGKPAFSKAERDQLNASPEAAEFGGLPTCTDGGAANNDGADSDSTDNSSSSDDAAPAPAPTTTQAPAAASGGDGECSTTGCRPGVCPFPMPTPWGTATDCNFLARYGYPGYCIKDIVGNTLHIAKCNANDPDCPF